MENLVLSFESKYFNGDGMINDHGQPVADEFRIVFVTVVAIWMVCELPSSPGGITAAVNGITMV
jgi:hypothetical protein